MFQSLVVSTTLLRRLVVKMSSAYKLSTEVQGRVVLCSYGAVAPAISDTKVPEPLVATVCTVANVLKSLKQSTYIGALDVKIPLYGPGYFRPNYTQLADFLQAEEQQINVAGQCINFVKTGTGSHSLLCFPGALGTIWSDFKPQIENLDETKFTIVAWDPPGYGKSRPPSRKFTANFYEKDADAAAMFMKAIGIKKYSLLGWSDGGISSMILAAKYPETVEKLIIWGANAYVLPKDTEAYEKIRDIHKWSDKMKVPLIKLYGEDGLQEMWNGWCDILNAVASQGGDICRDQLALIKSPTLILHGNLDPMVAAEHPAYLAANIKGSKLHRFPEGKHNIHLRYAEEFNAIVTRFLGEDLKAQI